MEVSQDIVLCDASAQYMFCDAEDFATLIIDFSSVGATSAPGLGCVETPRERRHKVVEVGEAR